MPTLGTNMDADIEIALHPGLNTMVQYYIQMIIGRDCQFVFI